MRATRYCRDSLAVERDDPDSHFLLSECYKRLFNQDNRREYLLQAKDNLEAVLRLNPDFEKAPESKKSLKQVTDLLTVVR